MAITEEQRAILIERLKKAQAAKASKKAAAVAAADTPVAPATKAPPKAPKAPKAPTAPKGEVIMKVKPLGETEFKEIRLEDPEEVEVPDIPTPTPTAAEVYAPVKAAAAPVVKRSEPIDIPHPKSDKKVAKDKGYMKLKFYTQPSPKVLKKLMAIHDESSSDEDSEDEVREMPKNSTPAPAADNERKMRLKQAADYYFNYY